MLTRCISDTSNNEVPKKLTKSNTDSIGNSAVTELTDTISVDFKTNKNSYSTGLLDSIINTIIKKGFFKPDIEKNGKLSLHKQNSRSLMIAYDSADMSFFITKIYLLNSIHITSLGFSGKRSKKNPQYKPGFQLEEWAFNNNQVRDSALQLINYIFSYPRSIVMYEKSYPQLITAKNRIIILTTGADIWEKYALEYKGIIESFLTKNQ
jgi:hypothetical protein